MQATNELILKNRHLWDGFSFKKWVYKILFRQFLLEQQEERKRRGVDLSEEAWSRIEDASTAGEAAAVVEDIYHDQTMMRLSEDHRNVLSCI